jgi:hypothetical protein
MIGRTVVPFPVVPTGADISPEMKLARTLWTMPEKVGARHLERQLKARVKLLRADGMPEPDITKLLFRHVKTMRLALAHYVLREAALGRVRSRR